MNIIEIMPDDLHFTVGDDIAWWVVAAPPEVESFRFMFRPNDPQYGWLEYEARVLDAMPVSEANPDILPHNAVPEHFLFKLAVTRA